jgi:arginase
VDVSLILVPSHAGDGRHPSSKGPERLLEAGAGEVVRSRGIPVSVERAMGGAAFRDTATTSAEVNRVIAALVSAAVEAERLPLVVAGSCNSALGVLAGFDHARCGVVWLDAHADFNTPESTISGFFAGMTMAVITGHCYRDYWANIGDNTPIAEDAIVMFGVRDLSPEAERDRLQASAIQVVEWSNGRPAGDLLAPLEELAGRVREVYLHVDFDTFAPEVAPGVVDEPAPGGLALDDAEAIITATMERFTVRAATLATYTPEFDHGDKTVRVALRIIELLGDHAGKQHPAEFP